MHKQVLHLRLSNYISKIDLGKTEVEDGYYRFMIQLKIDNATDLVHIKHSSFERYLGSISEIEGIAEAEYTEVKTAPTLPDKRIPIDSKLLDYVQIIGWGALIIYVLRCIYYGY